MDIHDLGFKEPEPDYFAKLQKKASAFAGFDITQPADFSALQILNISSEVAQENFTRKMHFLLKTELKGSLQTENEGEEEELRITIVRKSQRVPKI